jgi:hypothetical protein
MREYSVSTGTPILDWAKQELKAATTTATGETPVFTGTKDLVVQANNTDYQYTTAVATYGDGKFDGVNGGAWADLLNTTSTTPPTWTITSGSGNAATNGMAFATNATACNDQTLIDFSGGTNGTTMSAALLNSSAFGGAGSFGTASGSPATAMTFSTSAHQNLLTTFNSCDGHKTGSSTLGLNFDLSATTAYYIPYGWNPFNNNASAGYWFYTNIATSDAGYYSFTGIRGDLGSDSMGLMVHSGSLYLEAAGNPNGAPDTGSFFSYTANTWYWISEQYQTYVNAGSAHHFNIYSATGTLLSAQTKASKSTGSTQPDNVGIGRGGDSGITAGAYIQISNLKIDYSGTFPLLP